MRTRSSSSCANRKEDVVHFIDNAGRTATISAERSNDLAQNFHLLDDFLAQLKPTMFQLGNLAEQNTPLLTDLHAAAPGLNKLATHLPVFNSGTEQSLTSLGGAAHVGKTALASSKEEISALDQASTKAYPAADQVAQFLESASDPRNAGEEDACARYDLRQQPGEADRRVQMLDQKLSGDPTFTGLHGDQTVACKWANGAPAGTDPNGGNPGFTGLEGLLNYAYIQTNSLNLFDQLGHALGITLVEAPGTPTKCGYQTGPPLPAKGGGGTTIRATSPSARASSAIGSRASTTHGNRAACSGTCPVRQLGLPGRQHGPADLRREHQHPHGRRPAGGDPGSRSGAPDAAAGRHAAAAEGHPEDPQRRRPEQDPGRREEEAPRPAAGRDPPAAAPAPAASSDPRPQRSQRQLLQRVDDPGPPQLPPRPVMTMTSPTQHIETPEHH